MPLVGAGRTPLAAPVPNTVDVVPLMAISKTPFEAGLGACVTCELPEPEVCEAGEEGEDDVGVDSGELVVALDPLPEVGLLVGVAETIRPLFEGALKADPDEGPAGPWDEPIPEEDADGDPRLAALPWPD